MNRRLALAAIAVVSALLTASCVPPSTLPDGTVPQSPPLAVNGMAWDGDVLWVCDLVGGQMVAVDSATGSIVRRVGPAEGLQAPDDLVVLDDGTLIYTSPVTGVVGRVNPDGRVEVLAQLNPGVNPIALTPDATAVVVGFAFRDASTVVRVELADGSASVVAEGLPPLNSFSFGPDGRLWAPTGGVRGAFLGNGGLIRVDIETGETEDFALSFPEEPTKRGLSFAVAAKWGPDGRLRVLQGLDAAVYDVDPNTGEAHRLAHLPGGFGDNLAWNDDGRLVASGFVGSVYTVADSGKVTLVPLGS